MAVRITNRALKELPFDTEQYRQLEKMTEHDEDSLDGFRDYVIAVIRGAKKKDALESALPHRFAHANKRYETGEHGTFAKCLASEVNKIERFPLIKDMYIAQHKEWWKSFLLMKNQLFGNLFDLAMDDLPERDGKPQKVIPRDRIAASKTLLEHMPELQEEKVIKIESDDVEAEFTDKLYARQQQLLLLAKKSKEEAIDVDVEEFVKVKVDVLEIVEPTIINKPTLNIEGDDDVI